MTPPLDPTAQYWKQRYEKERERVAKLWVRYKVAEQELEALRPSGAKAPVESPPQQEQVPPQQEQVVSSIDDGRFVLRVTSPPAETVEAQESPPLEDKAEVKSTDPYRHGDYTLYTREVELNGGRKQRIYYFARKTKRGSTSCPLPYGYEVGVNERTGLPFLRKTGRAKAAAAGNVSMTTKKEYQAQCMALTADGAQCRNSSRVSSKYCASHKGYQPLSANALMATMDTAPGRAGDNDTAPALRGTPSEGLHGDRQCAAVTSTDGVQCLRHARDRSRYCTVHAGYQPRSAVVLLQDKDTKPHVKGAADTRPSLRKS